MAFDVVVATRNRPDPLRRTLASIALQDLRPTRLVVVDATPGEETLDVLQSFYGVLPVEYLRAEVASAAKQRNQGADVCNEPIIFFLDDDIDLEAHFFREILEVFTADTSHQVGGVSGTISNMNFREPRAVNRLLLRLCLWHWGSRFGGRVIGPGVNFATELSDADQIADWIPSTACAYRRDAFLGHRFPAFDGYSFAEDVHLSTHVGIHYKLLVAARARIFHHDLGASTHPDWRALGRSVVMNRLAICRLLCRVSVGHMAQLFLFELVYTGLAVLYQVRSRKRLREMIQLQIGKAEAFMDLLQRRLETAMEAFH